MKIYQTNEFTIFQLLNGEDICNDKDNIIHTVGAQMKNFSYIVKNEKTNQIILIDPAWDVKGILKKVSEIKKEKRKNNNNVSSSSPIEAIFLTHHHFDHCGGNPPPPYNQYNITIPGIYDILNLYNDVKIIIQQGDVEKMIENCSIGSFKSNVCVVNEKGKLGTSFPFNSLLSLIRFLPTPGHTKGSCCLLLNNKFLFTGDTLFQGNIGRMDLPDSSRSSMENSLFNIIGKLNEDIIVLPGHHYGMEKTSTIKKEKRYFKLFFPNHHENNNNTSSAL